MILKLDFDPRFRWHISRLHILQNDCAVYKAPYTTGTKICPLEIKRKGQETEHTLVSSAQIKNTWMYLHFIKQSWYFP